MGKLKEMKRSIKFRVWNSSKNEFNPLGGSVITIEDKTNTATLRPLEGENYIQQSLNLFDIDGNEIFEGDIVDLYAKEKTDKTDKTNKTTYKPKALHRACVRWIQAYACFGLYQYKDGMEVPIYKIDTKKLRVLSNILDSPAPPK